MVHKDYTIVGVAPRGLRGAMWMCMCRRRLWEDPNHTFNTEIRLKPGVTREQADAALLPLFQQFAKDRPRGRVSEG
jgi:hypothetical protein